MNVVNSLSGGKTSSYLAVHYPADFNIFSLVCIDDHICAPKDKGLIQKINDKLINSGCLQKHGEFIATAEDDKTLKIIFDLEQKIGREITWLRGASFDKLIKQKKMLPYKFVRFCTTEMKMKTIGEWAVPIMEQTAIDGIPQKLMNNVGIRYDEDNRVKEDRELYTKIKVGQSANGRNKWRNVNWGVVNYPLVYDKVLVYHIRKYWAKYPEFIFPDDSNCVGCFHKSKQQLRKNFDDNPDKFNWFARQESENVDKKYKWKDGTTYNNIKKLGLQSDFFYGEGAGCNSGFCTD